MKKHEAIEKIKYELDRARSLYPYWPQDPIHAAAVISEESGELTQAALDHTYRDGNRKSGDTIRRMEREAVQVGAMALRFLLNLDMIRNNES